MTFNPNSNWLNVKDFKEAGVPPELVKYLDAYIFRPAKQSDAFKVEGVNPQEIEFSVFRHTTADLEHHNQHVGRSEVAIDCVRNNPEKAAFRTMVTRYYLDMVFLARAPIKKGKKAVGTLERIVKVAQGGTKEFVGSRYLGFEKAGPAVYNYVANTRYAPPDAPPLIIEEFLSEDGWGHLYQLGKTRAHFARKLGEVIGTVHKLGVFYGDDLEIHLLYNRKGTGELKLIDFGKSSEIDIQSREGIAAAERDFAYGLLVLTEHRHMAPYIGIYRDAYVETLGARLRPGDLAYITRDFIIDAENPQRVENNKTRLERWLVQNGCVR